MTGPRDLVHTDEETQALLGLTRDIARDELAPRAAAAEAAGEFPREVFRTLGRSGLLGLPFAEQYGGAGVSYESYLQVVEELAAAWLTVGLGVSVHTLACYPLAHHGSTELRERELPAMIGGEQLGAYCLSEADSGSDAGSLRTTATHHGEHYLLSGTKAWVTHGGAADFYTVFARTGAAGPVGLSCLLVPAETPGLSAASPEHKMGLRGSPTAQVVLEGAAVATDRLVGAEGGGFGIAMSALEVGRLGLAACAIGLTRAALDLAVGYARDRRQFGRSLLDFQGVSFLLADIATGLEAGRALYLSAARRHDAGLPCKQEAAMAKLFCTDLAMRATTDVVQILGGYGYVQDHPAERYFREAKMLQIVEGTNQIQRVVIARGLTGEDH